MMDLSDASLSRRRAGQSQVAESSATVSSAVLTRLPRDHCRRRAAPVRLMLVDPSYDANGKH